MRQKDSGAVDQYAHDTACTGAASCAAFTLAASGGTVNVTSIKITENGTVTANTELSDINLYYDTDGNWSDAGAETLFGTAASFAADQTATISGTRRSHPARLRIYMCGMTSQTAQLIR